MFFSTFLLWYTCDTVINPFNTSSSLFQLYRRVLARRNILTFGHGSASMFTCVFVETIRLFWFRTYETANIQCLKGLIGVIVAYGLTSSNANNTDMILEVSSSGWKIVSESRNDWIFSKTPARVIIIIFQLSACIG